MLNWMKRRIWLAHHTPEPAVEAPKRHGRVMSGEYLLLYKYLEDRYANTVVLTFGEIEDILGFALPDQARLRPEWWADADPAAARAGYSDSWKLASRTAIANLVSRTVVFERAS